MSIMLQVPQMKSWICTLLSVQMRPMTNNQLQLQPIFSVKKEQQ